MHPVEKQEQDIEGKSQATKDHATDQETIAALSLEYRANQHLQHHFANSCPCHQHCGCTAFVLQRVLGVGQHAGEGAAEKQAQACRPHEQEDDVVGENKQHQERHHHADLSRQRWRRLGIAKS